jgi:hypothetical protein
MAGDLAEIDGGSYDPTIVSGNSDEFFNSETLVTGDGDVNAYPTISDNPQTPTDGAYSGTTQNLLGSVGTVIANLPKTATAIGTAVGTAQHNIAQAGTNYTAAETAAANGNNVGTWWQYASNTDKAMIILAVVGIIVAYEKG